MELAAVPRPRDCRQLTGQEDVYRIRVGVYRVIYSIEDRRIVVVMLELGDQLTGVRESADAARAWLRSSSWAVWL